MSFNIRDYVSDDHVESIGEIAKSQSNIIQALSLDNSQKDKEIERLREENILLRASEPMSKLQENYGYKAEVERLNNDIKELLKENGNKEKVIKEQDNIIKEVREYITGYESTSVIQSLNNIENNRGLDEKTMIEMDRRYLVVHDKILEILDKEK